VNRFAATAVVAAGAVGGALAQAGAPPISHEYAEVNGVRLHYAKTGTGPLIIFLHGFPEFWYEWKNQLLEFGRDHTAVAPDMRGYNLSSKPADLSAYAVPQLVEDIRALGAKLTDAKFTLVAHDWGGAVAWIFAALHPEMIDKLVIVNAPHPTVFARELRENPAQQQASQYMLLFRSPEAEATLSANNYATLVTAILGEGIKNGTVTDEDRAAYIAAWSQPGALTGGLNYYRASGVGPPKPGEAPNDLLSQPVIVRVPTLVIWGEKDTALLTGNLNGLEAFVPKLTIKRIPDATHWVVREKSPEVNRLIREFLAQ
jgi:pimeloyl-ACP methyl ester carboxylesterase